MPDTFEKAVAKTLGEKIDEYEAADAAVGAAEQIVKDKKSKLAEIEAELIELFTAAELKGAVGTNGAKATVKKKDFPGINDREVFNQFVKDNDAFDLFTAHINSKAYKARAEAGVNVPGVSIFSKTTVKLN